MPLRNKLLSRSVCCLLLLAAATGCKKYVTLPLPNNQIAGDGAFANNASAAAVVNNIYGILDNASFLQGANGIPYNSGLYTDELVNASTSTTSSSLVFYTNALTAINTAAVTAWNGFFQAIYSANLAIGALTPSQLTMRNQLLGETYFLRAFSNFYLTNLYGTVPLQLTSDYSTNNKLARSAQADVYKQIVADLKQAQGLLTNNYLDVTGAPTTDRGRPNRMAVMALLARVYLYTADWSDAEAQADSLIGATATYQLTPLAQTFLVGSPETIWGFAPVGSSYLVGDAAGYYIAPGTTPQTSGVGTNLSTQLINAFEPGDARLTNWVGVSNVAAAGSQPAATYYYASKYKARTTQTKPAEYLSLLRLGEQYLIRAEARTQQGKLSGAAADLNAIRARAGLQPSSAATQPALLAAILHERQVELFTEGGHRFFDLRRTGSLDAVMNTVAPLKNATWSSTDQWWPIMNADIVIDPNLVQTPGY